MNTKLQELKNRIRGQAGNEKAWVGLPRFSELFLKHFPEAKIEHFINEQFELCVPANFEAHVCLRFYELETRKNERKRLVALVQFRSEKNPRPGTRYLPIEEQEQENE